MKKASNSLFNTPKLKGLLFSPKPLSPWSHLGSRSFAAERPDNLGQQVRDKRKYEQEYKAKRLARGRPSFSSQKDETPVVNPPANDEAFIVTKTPSDSKVEFVLPLSSDAALRDSYVNLHGDVRIGRILEDLDALAAEIAYKHSDGGSPLRPLTCVTASCDRIDLKRVARIKDYKFHGCVTWVGKSSMEVRIEVDELNTQEDGTVKFDPLLTAEFTMVALHRFAPKAAQVNRLAPQTEIEKELYAMGEANKERRKLGAKLATLQLAPTAPEALLIHELFLESKRFDAEGQHDDKKFVYMDTTHTEKTLLMHPQERNAHGKIFGGYLMREAFELAWVTAYMFCRERPLFKALDENHFLKPVPIGTIVTFSSKIVYTTTNSLEIRVAAEVVNPQTGQHETTNIFHFEFESKVPAQVLPRSYEEACLYLNAKRVHDKSDSVWAFLT